MSNTKTTPKKKTAKKAANPDVKMATNAQTWALYCIYKKDYRGAGLTYDEADRLIKEGNKKKGNTPTPKVAPKKEGIAADKTLKQYIDQGIAMLAETLKACISGGLLTKNKAEPITFTYDKKAKHKARIAEILEEFESLKKYFRKRIKYALPKEYREKQSATIDNYLLKEPTINRQLALYVSAYLNECGINTDDAKFKIVG